LHGSTGGRKIGETREGKGRRGQGFHPGTGLRDGKKYHPLVEIGKRGRKLEA